MGSGENKDGAVQVGRLNLVSSVQVALSYLIFYIIIISYLIIYHILTRAKADDLKIICHSESRWHTTHIHWRHVLKWQFQLDILLSDVSSHYNIISGHRKRVLFSRGDISLHLSVRMPSPGRWHGFNCFSGSKGPRCLARAAWRQFGWRSCTRYSSYFFSSFWIWSSYMYGMVYIYVNVVMIFLVLIVWNRIFVVWLGFWWSWLWSSWFWSSCMFRIAHECTMG